MLVCRILRTLPDSHRVRRVPPCTFLPFSTFPLTEFLSFVFFLSVFFPSFFLSFFSFAFFQSSYFQDRMSLQQLLFRFRFPFSLFHIDL